jgi:hypothetical protein
MSAAAAVHLGTALAAAVPLWIAQLRHCFWAEIQERSRRCSQVVAEQGDVILYRSKKAGGSAAAFNALAEGLACLAFAPGGVTAFGNHWEGALVEE